MQARAKATVGHGCSMATSKGVVGLEYRGVHIQLGLRAVVDLVGWDGGGGVRAGSVGAVSRKKGV